jgi:alpha-glucosidase
MLAAPVTSPSDRISGLANEKIWLPKGDWIEWPTGKRFTGPASVDRAFSIEQTPVYLRVGAIVPMQPPMMYTGQKPVDPLIVNVLPLAPGGSSSYSVYDDSGVSVEYQRGVFARTPIKATQIEDTLRVEIGPVQGGFPGMPRARAYELRLPADWPPASVTVNGVAVRQADVMGKGGWSFVGNTLTTVIPVPTNSVAARVTIEVHRAKGLTARRAELDGVAGALTRLRGAYDALQQSYPFASAPDAVIDALQTGDRLTYHPELAGAEILRFRTAVLEAQVAVTALRPVFLDRLSEGANRFSAASPGSAEFEAKKQRRLDAFRRAELLLAEASK